VLKKFLLSWTTASLLLLPALTSADPRFTASFQLSYQGAYQDLFVQQQERVRLLVRQSQVEVSSQLGLFQYQEGFRLPLTIRFADTTNPGAEHALAFVHFVNSSSGLQQEMVVNLSVCAQNPRDFDVIFYHEMTHAVMLDAMGPEQALALPRWVHEGLATYVSGEGKERVHEVAQHFHKSTVGRIVHDIDEPGVVDYIHAYLAFQYLKEKYSVNALQGFVRDVIQGKTAPAAFEDMTGVPYDRFRHDLQEYTLATLQNEARPDGT
jgi:hypothetical protein